LYRGLEVTIKKVLFVEDDEANPDPVSDDDYESADDFDADIV
jgi:hypothetical protein